jgi:hypothetical protein
MKSDEDTKTQKQNTANYQRYVENGITDNPFHVGFGSPRGKLAAGYDIKKDIFG